MKEQPSQSRKYPAGILPVGPRLWFVRARVRTGGKIRQKKNCRFEGTLEQAKTLLAEFKKALRESGPRSLTALDVQNFDDLLKFYVEKRGILSPSHERKVKFLRAELGVISLNGFADRFESWLKIERHVVRNRRGKTIKGRIPSPAKVNRIIEIVRAAFNLGLALGLVKESPITKARFPKFKEIPRDSSLSQDQIEKLLAVIDGERPHLSPIIRFALAVPCRKMELVNLRKADVDLFNNVVRIRNGETKNDAGVYKPIPPTLLQYFRDLPADCEFVFFKRDENGGCRPLGDFRRSFNWCLKQAGISGIRFHDTRHIAATNLVDNGTPEQVVMTVANWKTNMLRTYYHREPKRLLGLIQWGDAKKCETGCVTVKPANI